MLLRILLNDDPKQSRQAHDIVDRAADLVEAVLLSDVLLCDKEHEIRARPRSTDTKGKVIILLYSVLMKVKV